MLLDYTVINEQGGREYQEDSTAAYVLDDAAAFWVADGLGGHGHGKDASETVIMHCRNGLEESESAEEYFQMAFLGGNELLLEEQNRLGNRKTMKTTLVGCLLREQELTWAHIGDSRFYLFKNGKMVFRTRDHSVPQLLALSGRIQESEIRNHPDRNRVLRVLGAESGEAKYEIGWTVLAEEGMSILLCTDGFWELITEERMETCLQESRNSEEWMERMREHVLKTGEGKNMDNFTAVGIRM